MTFLNRWDVPKRTRSGEREGSLLKHSLSNYHVLPHKHGARPAVIVKEYIQWGCGTLSLLRCHLCDPGTQGSITTPVL